MASPWPLTTNFTHSWAKGSGSAERERPPHSARNRLRERQQEVFGIFPLKTKMSQLNHFAWLSHHATVTHWPSRISLVRLHDGGMAPVRGLCAFKPRLLG